MDDDAVDRGAGSAVVVRRPGVNDYDRHVVSQSTRHLTGRETRLGKNGTSEKLRGRVCSVAAAPRRDRPHRVHAVTAHDVDAVVEVDGRVAVRREELDALAEPGRARGIGDGEPAVLVAGESVREAGPLDRLGRKRLVGRERLEPAIDD